MTLSGGQIYFTVPPPRSLFRLATVAALTLGALSVDRHFLLAGPTTRDELCVYAKQCVYEIINCVVVYVGAVLVFFICFSEEFSK